MIAEMVDVNDLAGCLNSVCACGNMLWSRVGARVFVSESVFQLY